MKKRQGFSLVELIVVILILSVMVGVLAPAYLRYVEKSKVSADVTAAEEIRHAAEIVVLSGTYEVSQEVLVTFDKNGVIVENTDVAQDLRKYLEEDFGDLTKIKPVSKTYADKTYSIYIQPVDQTTNEKAVYGEWN